EERVQDVPGEVERERALETRQPRRVLLIARLVEPGEGFVGPFHVGGVVLVVVKLHDLARDVGLERPEVVRQIRKRVGRHEILLSASFGLARSEPGRRPLAMAPGLHRTRAIGFQSVTRSRQGGLDPRLGTGFALVALLIGLLAAVTWWNTGRLVQAALWVEHSRTVMADLDALYLALTGAESSQRAYIITGLPSYLQPLRAAAASFHRTFDPLDRPARHHALPS